MTPIGMPVRAAWNGPPGRRGCSSLSQHLVVQATASRPRRRSAGVSRPSVLRGPSSSSQGRAPAGRRWYRPVAEGLRQRRRARAGPARPRRRVRAAGCGGAVTHAVMSSAPAAADVRDRGHLTRRRRGTRVDPGRDDGHRHTDAAREVPRRGRVEQLELPGPLRQSHRGGPTHVRRMPHPPPAALSVLVA